MNVIKNRLNKVTKISFSTTKFKLMFNLLSCAKWPLSFC